MGYRCLACGSEGSFNATQSCTQYCTENITMDSEGNIDEYNDCEVDESEVTDGPTDVECCECDSTDVEWFDSEEEYEERQKEFDEETMGVEVPKWKEKIVGETWKDRMEAKDNA